MPVMLRSFLGTIAAMLVAVPAFAQAPNAAKLAAIRVKMQQFVDKGELGGAVTLIGRKGGIVHHEAIGFRDVEAKVDMAKDSLFRIASMTKPITAMAVMMLAEEGKLKPGDAVEKYLPEFKNQKLVASRMGEIVTLKKPSRAITIADLMSHTSGLPGGYPAGLGDVYGLRHRTLNETTLVISQQPLHFEPGSKWSYCNSGIDVLGRIVEVVSGQSYEQFLQDRIFTPLEMTDTTFKPNAEQLKRLASIYGFQDGKRTLTKTPFLAALSNSKHPIPAGGLCSTAGDLAKLYRCLLQGGTIDGKKIIGEATLAEMTKTQTGDIKTGFTDGMSFGYGFQVVKTPTGITANLSPGAFGHGGAFGTQGWIDPKQDLFVVLMIQRTGIPNGDASTYRAAFQQLAVEALNL